MKVYLYEIIQYPYARTNLNGHFNEKVAQRPGSSYGYGYPYGENHSPAVRTDTWTGPLGGQVRRRAFEIPKNCRR